MPRREASTPAPASALTPEEHAAVREARLAHDLRRLVPAVAVLLPVILLHALYFSSVPAEAATAAAEWRARLATAHETLLVALAILGALAWVAGRSPGARWRAVVPPLAAVVGAVAGGVIAGIDQLVTSAITPFVITSFGLALLLRLRRWQAVAVQLLGLGVLARLVVALQASEAGRVSALVNGFSVAVIGAAIAVTLTRAFDRAERSRLLIARQGRELAELRGLLRICAYCGRIHDEARGWERLDAYVARNSQAEFSHGMCEDCFHREMAKVGR